MRKLFNYELERLANEELFESIVQDFDFSKKHVEQSSPSAPSTSPFGISAAEDNSVVAHGTVKQNEVVIESRESATPTSQKISQSNELEAELHNAGSATSPAPKNLAAEAATPPIPSPVGPTGPTGPAGPARSSDTPVLETDDGRKIIDDTDALHSVHASSAMIAGTGLELLPSNASLSSGDLPEGYVSANDGIYVVADEDGADPVYVCSPIRVVAKFTDARGKGHGRLIGVRSIGETWHDVPVYNSDMERRSGEVVGTLLDHGLELATDRRTKDRLLTFLKLSKPNNRLQTVPRMGWVDNAYDGFVLGRSLIGRQDVLPTSNHTVVGLQQAGDAAAWRKTIGEKCIGNPLMVLATSLAFSGPLLAPLGMTSGGLHFRGASSSGKTTLLRVAASVWGNPRLISSWCGTQNGLEAIAGSMNDLLLPLDEIAEIAARDLHGTIYMLGNGAGKTRMTKDVVLADQAAWRLALISSGEISVRDKLKEAHLEAKAGHEVRLIDIEADSHTYGAFDFLHGAKNAAIFADGLQKSSVEHHGTVGMEFIRLLIAGEFARNGDRLERIVQTQSSKLLSKIPVLDGQVQRVAKRFVAIGIAGEIATQFELTGWPKGEALSAAEQGFLDWHDRRYSMKREAADDYIKSLQDFIAANLRMMPLIGASLAAKGDPDPVGWKDRTRVYLPSETWSQLFPGNSGAAAAKAVLDLNLLVPGEEAGRFTRKGPRALPGRKRVYTLTTDRLMSYRPE